MVSRDMVRRSGRPVASTGARGTGSRPSWGNKGESCQVTWRPGGALLGLGSRSRTLRTLVPGGGGGGEEQAGDAPHRYRVQRLWHVAIAPPDARGHLQQPSYCTAMVRRRRHRRAPRGTLARCNPLQRPQTGLRTSKIFRFARSAGARGDPRPRPGASGQKSLGHSFSGSGTKRGSAWAAPSPGVPRASSPLIAASSAGP